MTRVAAVGECMAELTHQNDHLLRLDYAGDTFNTAVYLARLGSDDGIQVDYVTRLGDDWYSDRAIDRMASEGLRTTYIQRVPGRSIGLYLIHTDGSGERSFTYYRSEAPARGMFGPDHPASVDDALAPFDHVYLSAITLQILTEPARSRLWRVLDAVRANGGTVAFDSNYRPTGWPDRDAARAAVQQTLRRTDIALPSLADEQALFADSDAAMCAERIHDYGVPEIVVKDGPVGCFVRHGVDELTVPAVQVANVVDTTAAGDSFNAGYLAARLTGVRPAEAAAAGHRLAATVIQHPGAIVRTAYAA